MLYDLFIKLEKVNDDEHKGLCPFHTDVAPSFFANSRTHQWNCFGCGEGGGEVKFIQKYFDVSDDMARYALEYYEKHNKLPFPSLEQIQELREELKKQPAVVNYLHAIGVTDEIIDKYELGWELSKNRITVPIRSKTGLPVNIRRYMPPGQKRTKNTPKTINVSGLGDNRYFPYEAFEQDIVYVLEGEKDVLVARSQGLNAVTATGGTNLPVTEIQLFKDKIVYLVTDSDRAGDKIVKKYLPLLKPIVKEVHRIKLPVKDFADYWESYKDTDILQYAASITEAVEHNAEALKLIDSLRVDTMDSTIVLENMKITGKHFNNYVLPSKLTINCAGLGCKKECPYRDTEVELAIEERDMLSFIQASDTAQGGFLKKTIGCSKANIVKKEYTNAQMIYFQEDLNSMTTEDYYNQMQTGVYLFDSKPLYTNKTYNFTAIKTSDPKTQQIIYVVLDAEEKNIDIEVNEQELQIFKQNAEGRPINELFEEYYEKWLPHLEVVDRPDLFRAMTLTFLSPIGYYWGNTLVKGWLDCLVIGDTRTGKSKMAKNFMKTIGLGAYISGENSRKTGVIGGVQKLGDNWSLSWGIVPLNDKRFVLIDEASGLTVEDIQELSQMRSEGIISITKIVSESTTARTRLFWITNPRSGKQLSDYYWKGVDALKEFLPIQEDLARFDVVLTAGLEDVSDIHKDIDLPQMPAEELNLWRQLILFAWSLKPEQIVIPKDVTKYIIQKSDELGDKYKGLPLFLKTNGYEKLTRIAISTAILTYAYENNVVTITRNHVDSAIEFLQMCYQKDSFGFAAYSKKENEVQNMNGDKKQAIKNLFDLYPNLGILFEGGAIRNYVIQEVLGIEKDDANKLIAELLRLGFIRITSFGYKATPQFLDAMRKFAVDF